jgi:hypothetical protein
VAWLQLHHALQQTTVILMHFIEKRSTAMGSGRLGAYEGDLRRPSHTCSELNAAIPVYDEYSSH